MTKKITPIPDAPKETFFERAQFGFLALVMYLLIPLIIFLVLIHSRFASGGTNLEGFIYLIIFALIFSVIGLFNDKKKNLSIVLLIVSGLIVTIFVYIIYASHIIV